MSNSSKSNFLHQGDLELWDSGDLPNFTPLYPKKCLEPCIFCSFCKVFTFYTSRKNVWKLTVNQTSTVPHNSLLVSCARKRLFCRFVLFCRTKWVSLNFAVNKNSPFPKNVLSFLSARSISSTMQDILLQKSTELEMEEKKEFYVKAKE